MLTCLRNFTAISGAADDVVVANIICEQLLRRTPVMCLSEYQLDSCDNILRYLMTNPDAKI